MAGANRRRTFAATHYHRVQDRIGFVKIADNLLIGTLVIEAEVIGQDQNRLSAALADLLAHIAREREHAAFSFEELEELEADLGKIQRWFADVRQRDWFRAPAGRAAERALASCERRVRGFAERASREDLAARAVGPLARPRAAADAPPKRNRRSRG